MISKNTKKELIEVLRKRYRVSSKKEKMKILDYFVSLTGYHRKHAIRLLSGFPKSHKIDHCYDRRIYNEAVREAVVILFQLETGSVAKG